MCEGTGSTLDTYRGTYTEEHIKRNTYRGTHTEEHIQNRRETETGQERQREAETKEELENPNIRFMLLVEVN